MVWSSPSNSQGMPYRGQHMKTRVHHCPYEGCSMSYRDSADYYKHRKTCPHRTQQVDQLLKTLAPRSKSAANKPFSCRHVGCDKAFYHTTNRSRHSKLCHFRPVDYQDTDGQDFVSVPIDDTWIVAGDTAI